MALPLATSLHFRRTLSRSDGNGRAGPGGGALCPAAHDAGPFHPRSPFQNLMFLVRTFISVNAMSSRMKSVVDGERSRRPTAAAVRPQQEAGCHELLRLGPLAGRVRRAQALSNDYSEGGFAMRAGHERWQPVSDAAAAGGQAARDASIATQCQDLLRYGGARATRPGAAARRRATRAAPSPRTALGMGRVGSDAEVWALRGDSSAATFAARFQR